ncbi:MAG: hypothetical protein KDD64_17440 [Bdellovibrionales bacterium]|nr:hypothetical protein [Bdellovibrionales bacterium]
MMAVWGWSCLRYKSERLPESRESGAVVVEQSVLLLLALSVALPALVFFGSLLSDQYYTLTAYDQDDLFVMGGGSLTSNSNDSSTSLPCQMVQQVCPTGDNPLLSRNPMFETPAQGD